MVEIINYIMAEVIDGKAFEKEVSHIAHALWPSALGGSETVDGKERDGIYHTEDIVHIIEATTSKSKEKTQYDLKKVIEAIKIYLKAYPEKAIKGWLITLHEPTADQRALVNATGTSVSILSFDRFQAKIIDVNSYFLLREKYPYGSARDLSSGNYQIHGNYIPIDLLNEQDRTEMYSVREVALKVIGKAQVVVRGHFGVGKSMMLREVYRILRREYEKKTTTKFPVYINLRDHQGQIDPVEAMERHARQIGYPNPDHLVRAWRAGYIYVILDGFDEIAAFSWAGKTSTLKDVRFRSMELIRRFLKEGPQENGLIVAGRLNYFDSPKECETAFALRPNKILLEIGDFTHEQVVRYLSERDVKKELPDWIPSRPLLLGYLVANGILSDILTEQEFDTPSQGWDFLLTEVSKREALIETGLSHEDIRELIEKLATYTRKFEGGLGPIYQKDLEDIFREKTGYPPDDRALVLLQRLPGLESQNEQDSSRHFIDGQYVNAARAGENIRYAQNPYSYRLSSDPRNWRSSLDTTGIGLLSYKIAQLSEGLVEEAIIRALSSGLNVLAIDLLVAFNELGKSWTREHITIQDVIVPSFEINPEANWSRVTFQEVIFKDFYVEGISDDQRLPTLKNCVIGTLFGYSNRDALPPELFDTTDIEGFEQTNTTTAALMSLGLTISERVCLTILKKLYLQAGGGRQENALYRGLSVHERPYVPLVLEYLKHEGLAVPSKKLAAFRVWQPSRNQIARIRNIIYNRAYHDDILVNVRSIKVI